LTFPAKPLTTQAGSPLFSVAPATTNGCGVGIPYAPGAGCNFIASFAPVIATTATASVAFNTNASNTAAVSASLSGTGLYLVSTGITLSVTSPTGGIHYSQSVTLTAVLTPSTVTVAPTGTLTFTIDGKTQSPVPIANGTVTLTLKLAVGTHAVTVTYSGDHTYASSAASTNFTENLAVTTNTLTVAPLNTNGAISLLFTAALASTTATGETGTVTFYSGTTPLASNVPLSILNGVYTASYSTASLVFPSTQLYAVYTGDNNFAPATSNTVQTGTGDFAVGSVSSSFAIPQGGIGYLGVTLASLFGGSGTITASCTGLPQNSVCRFFPVSIPLGNTPQTVSVQIYTDVSSTLAKNFDSPMEHSRGNTVLYASIFPLGLAALCMRKRKQVRSLVLIVLCFGVLVYTTGCGTGSGENQSSLVTPVGTYPITVVFTGSNGLNATHNASVNLTVLPAQ